MKFVNLKNGAVMNKPDSELVLCLGNFDGVHKGHRQLIKACNDFAAELNTAGKHLKSGVWFFGGSSEMFGNRIFSDERKLEVFSSLGTDIAIIADFEELKNLSGENFVNEILKKQCRCVYTFCGANFRFGINASRTSDDLVVLMDGNARVIPLVSFSGEIVSSTRIRTLLSLGKIEEANFLLDDNYRISGTVIHGKALGRTLGLPTMNLALHGGYVTPENGIYVTVSEINGKYYHSVTNIGTRPTVENTVRKNAETHVIGFSGDCYGQNITVEFLHRLRDEIKFNSVDELKEQILLDIKNTELYFKSRQE